MATINLYKILDNKQIELMEHLRANYSRIGEQVCRYNHLHIRTGELIELVYEMSLYFGTGTEDKPLSWNWVLNAFGHQNFNIDGSPKAVIHIHCHGAIYAITFGHSYFKVDQFSDKEWAFEFARRLDYTNIRTTAITNPNSQRNKTINTYLEYENLDLGSGEALTKLKAKIALPEEFTLFAETIEVGNSIRVNTENANIDNICGIIGFVESTIENELVKVKIPYFRMVKEQEEIESLTGLMKQDIGNDFMSIDFSEYQIYATHIVFNDNHEYELRHRYKNEKYDRVTVENVRSFMQKYEFNITDDLLDIRVVVLSEGKSIYQTNIEKLIFYTNEQSHALLADGSWFIYNEDYLQYLKDSIAEIPVEFEERFNYRKALHDEYLEQALQRERNTEKLRELDDAAARKKIKQKYYKERYYNNWLVDLDVGFVNFDRDLESIGKHQVEVMDLYKDNSMFAVKIGNSSGKLCYAVDQSIEAIKAYHRGDVVIDKEIENVYLWFVLEREELPLVNGTPDINDLSMLILKNKLDQWKKEVRLLGYRPKIKINYARD